MKEQSGLVAALNITNRAELEVLTTSSSPATTAVLMRVIFGGYSYSEAGAHYKKSKHAVYESLKRLYKKKYGEQYGSKGN